MKFTLKQLKDAFQEMIEVLELGDEETNEPLTISKKATEEDLTEEIKKAAELIDEENDEFTKPTLAVIDALTTSAPKAKGKKEIEAEPEDEKKEKGEDYLTDLKKEVEDADEIDDLKDFVNECDEFKSLRKRVEGYKKIAALRQDMLNILEELMGKGEEITETDPDENQLEAEKELEEADLVGEVESTKTIGGLKNMVKTNDVFVKLRKKLAEYKDADELREDMLDLITPKKETAKETKKPAAKAEKVEKEKKASKKTDKGPGVIATIASLIEKSGKKGITKDAILEHLVGVFPDKNESSMKATINVQVPARISKERFAVEKFGEGLYRKKA